MSSIQLTINLIFTWNSWQSISNEVFTLTKMFDLDILFLQFAFWTLKLDNKLGLSISLNLSSSVLGLNNEAEVLDS